MHTTERTVAPARRAQRLGACLGAALVAGACGAPAGELEVFAAASLREVCEELGPVFEREHSGVRVRFDFAGSNLLAEQIISSTHGGVFLSADDLQMERVALTGRLVPDSRREFLANTLVVVVPADDARELRAPADLVRDSIERLSLANPEAVPAGRYARTWLQTLGLWDDLRHKVVPAIDVRGALLAVESGAAQAGICYATDAAVTERVRVALRAGGPAAPAVRYEAAAVKPGSTSRAKGDGAERATALAFLDFLGGAHARGVFEAHGFRLPEEGP